MIYEFKQIAIDFASSQIKASDEYARMMEAVEWSAANLRARHRIILRHPKQTINGPIVVSVGIPETIGDNFCPGRHLRGISLYLLKEYPERYKQYLKGKRLLTYTEVPSYKPLFVERKEKE